MVQRLCLLICSLMIITTHSVCAHQLKAAQTTVLFNKSSNHLEVMHRFYLHDTEHAVEHIFDKKADILNSHETQKAFAHYVSKQFLARDLSDNDIVFNNAGFEVEGKFFWVYQETQLPKKAKGLKLFNGTLRDLWPTQVNMVNIEGKGKVRTLYFTDNDDWLVTKF